MTGNRSKATDAEKVGTCIGRSQKGGVGKEQNDTTVTTLVHITGNGPHHQRVTEEKRTKEAPHYVATDHA